MKPTLYTGTLRHRRLVSRPHEFSYRICMFHFDLAEADHSTSWFWYRYQRQRYLINPEISIDQIARELVYKKTGKRPTGKIYLLTQLTCLGYCFNPISLYFFINDETQRCEDLLLEVTNTPWGEKHFYILTEQECSRSEGSTYHYRFKKELHVSPFLPMDYEYKLHLKYSNESIIVHMENYHNSELHFDATLTIKPNRKSALKTLLRFPLMPQKIAAGIYWQAFKLMLKRVKFYSHP